MEIPEDLQGRRKLQAALGCIALTETAMQASSSTEQEAVDHLLEAFQQPRRWRQVALLELKKASIYAPISLLVGVAVGVTTSLLLHRRGT